MNDTTKAKKARMIGTLSILAALAALALSAAPVASAGPAKAKPPRPGVGSFSIDIGTSENLVATDRRRPRVTLEAATAAARTSNVKDGTSNTVMVAERAKPKPAIDNIDPFVGFTPKPRKLHDDEDIFYVVGK